MADPGRYEESAKGLQKKLGTKEAIRQGFRRLSRAEVEKIVSQAGDPDIGKAPERKDLEAALLKKGFAPTRTCNLGEKATTSCSSPTAWWRNSSTSSPEARIATRNWPTLPRE